MIQQQLALTTKGHHQSVRVTTATIAALLLRAVLDFAYINYVEKYFSSSFGAGILPLHEIRPIRLLESYVLVFFLAIWLSSSLYSRWRPSGIVLVLYFAIVMLPLTSLYGLVGAPPVFVYAAAGSFAVLLIVTGLLPRVKIPRPGRVSLMIGGLALAGIPFYVYGMLLSSGGIGRLSFDLLSVYEVRAEYVQTGGAFMGYFVPWQATVINIGFLVYALHKRRYWLMALAGVAQLLIFGMTGHKSFLLAPVLAGGVYLIWQKRNALFYIFGGATLLVLASYILFLVTGNQFPPSLLIRRLLFVPAGNHLIYYDFFSQPENPLVMLSNSFLAPFVSYPYEMSVTRVISWAYWGRDFGPNVGYLGDAFAQFGLMGMFLFSMILGVFLRILDSVGSRLPSNLVAAIVAVPAMALANSALFTSLLTHGLIPTLILLWLLRAMEARWSSVAELKNVVYSRVRRHRMETEVNNSIDKCPTEVGGVDG